MYKIFKKQFSLNCTEKFAPLTRYIHFTSKLSFSQGPRSAKRMLKALGISCCTQKWIACGLLVAVAPLLLIPVVVTLLRLVLVGKVDALSGATKKQKDRHVLVTGGSSGIGLEVAKLYAKNGDKVTIVARNAKKLEEAKQSIIKETKCNDSQIHCLSCDVGDGMEKVEKAFAKAKAVFGAVDILINSAGITYISSFDTSDIQEYEKVMRVNYLGSVYATRAVIEDMKARKSGSIVFVSSQVAQASIHGFTAYAGSKWALRGFAEALQMEVRPFQICVSVSYPPDTDTPMYQEEMKTKPDVTKEISDSSVVMSPQQVARDIFSGVSKHAFTISHGLEGWALAQLHPGMSPLNNLSEVMSQVAFASLLRFVTCFYLVVWEYLVEKHEKNNNKNNAPNDKKTK